MRIGPLMRRPWTSGRQKRWCGSGSGRWGRGSAVRFAASGERVHRPAHLELRRIEALWDRFSRLLATVERQPVGTLARSPEPRVCRGRERLTGQDLTRLVSLGVDPRRANAEGGVTLVVRRTLETLETTEHRTLRAFVDRLQEAV